MKFLSGLADCHLPGLYSLVLSERESPDIGMRRVFYAGPDCSMDLWEGADFRLKPHNHRQTIRLTKLFGVAINHKVLFDKFGGLALWKYCFKSALLDGSFGLDKMWREDARLSSAPLTGEAIRMHWSDVHTVSAYPESAWLVEEFELAPAGIERCWSVSDHLHLSSEDLYRPLLEAELREIEEKINRRLQRAASNTLEDDWMSCTGEHRPGDDRTGGHETQDQPVMGAEASANIGKESGGNE